MLSALRADEFDFEAATNLLSVLARVEAAAIRCPDAPAWVDEVARRFCVSRAATDMLCMAVRGSEPYEAQVRQGHAEISGIAEKAMYGLAVGSGQRNSMRFALGDSEYIGMRMQAERLRIDQTRFTGAS